MARVKCSKCKAECCSCWGCDPKKYVNGLCPKCQREKQNDVKTDLNGVQGLQKPVKPSV